ncbi:XRE family transcriptional regulator [Streptomyces sp. NBC_01622]|uniref:helix-turn-helix domain-containing protein n=1 Tax=Streptomyces sp. NBC_01622 TaxID=2975903 RepID=UPI00386C6F0C|nr:XRE family transcriptional regulator [Streptomyces sp. NBC_01622]
MSQLAAALRELRAATGLSMAGLAAKTPYSKSSWERYLNGRTLPPREAVEELCRLAGEPVGRCLALWEIAESEASGRGASVPVPDEPAPAPPVAAPPSASSAPSAPEQRGVATLAVLASVCAVAVSAVVLALVLLPGPSKSTPLSPTAASSTATVASGPGCHGADCAGRSPFAMLCAPQPDTITQRETATGAWVELRHSKICGTTWARMWGGRIGDRIELVVPGRAGSGHAAEVGNAAEVDTYAYTMMAVTAPGTVVRVCFQPAGTGTGKRECFDGRVT